MQPTANAQRKAMYTRLRRIEGQLRGLQRLVEEEADCEQVVQQLAAARKALDKAFYQAIACALEQELDPLAPQARVPIAHYTQLLAKYG